MPITIVDIHKQPLTTLVDLIHQQKLQASEVTDIFLRRIKAFNSDNKSFLALAEPAQVLEKSALNAKLPLAGLPIAQALGIKIEGVASGPDWENTASRTLIAAMTACQFPKLNLRCVKHVTDCSIMISKNRDLKSFEVCISDFKTDS